VPGTDDDVVASYEALASVAAEAVWGFEEELAFIDLETTGFDPTRDAVIEVGLVVSRGPEVLERYTSLVDPGRSIPRETSVLTGISEEDVAGAAGLDEVMAAALELVGDRDLVAHNCSFDRSFVEPAASALGVRLRGEWLDSLQLARIALPRLSCHRLADLAEAFGLGPAAHRADQDAEATFRLWRLALAGLQELPAEVVSEMAALWPDVE
jgi:ATP-dependent DNA helicase DinG